MISSSRKDPTQEEGSVGEVSVQVDVVMHPGSGEHKITVKGKTIKQLTSAVVKRKSHAYILLRTSQLWQPMTSSGLCSQGCSVLSSRLTWLVRIWPTRSANTPPNPSQTPGHRSTTRPSTCKIDLLVFEFDVNRSIIDINYPLALTGKVSSATENPWTRTSYISASRTTVLPVTTGWLA